jgi:phenylacetate-CoA ligase
MIVTVTKKHMSHGGFPLESIERASTDELRALQLERLKASVAAAYAVPHYKAKFDAIGVQPTDIQQLSDYQSCRSPLNRI